MKLKITLLVSCFFLFQSCSKEENTRLLASNSVLVLKVDYTTNTFEGGKELIFQLASQEMTISKVYTPPSDFGNLTLIYNELNEVVFDGTIVWNGLGQINYPQNFLSANQFDYVETTDYIVPSAGFENVFNSNNTVYDYNVMWSSVQGLVKVREYLAENPDATVKVFLYTPSVAVGNPEEWDWIILMKN